ncbi:MAG: hypothetical protein WC942_05620, partial [Clostridia bacterium]
RKIEKVKVERNKFFNFILFQIIICLLSINIFSVLGKLDYPFFNNLNAILKASVSAYPGDTFTKEEKIKFVAQFIFGDALYVSGNSNIEFSLPLDSDNITVQNGIVKISVTSFSLVSATEDGIVSSVGKSGDIKFVEIKHTNNIKTRCSGFDYVGVAKNYITPKYSPIGTISEGVLEFSIIYKGKTVTDLTIVNGEFVW